MEKLRSRQILLGTKSPAIAAAIIKNEQNNAEIRAVRILLERKVTSLKSILLRNAMEQEIAVLRVRTDDMEERRNWIAEFSGADARSLPAGREERFSLAVELTERGKGGIPGELLRIHRVVFTLFDPVSGVSWESVHDGPFPVHQTVQARLTSVRNALGDSGVLEEGAGQTVGAFSMGGELLPETRLSIEEFQFTVEEAGVAASRWRLERDAAGTIACFRNSNDAIVACPLIEGDIGVIAGGPVVFRLLADVQAVGTGAHALRVSLYAPGSIGESGALRWSDGTGRYNWVDLPEPLAAGTRWEVR